MTDVTILEISYVKIHLQEVCTFSLSPAAFLQSSGLGLVLSNIFIDDLDRGGECPINNFEDKNNLGGADDSLKEQDALQRDLQVHWSIGQWLIGWSFKKNKCQILHLRWSNTRHKYKLGEEQLESSSADRDLGVLVGRWLIISQHCAQVTRRANCILECVKHSTTSQVKEVIITMYSELVWPHLEHRVRFWAPELAKDGMVLKCVQRWTTKLLKGREGYRKQLRTLALSCEKRRAEE